MLIIAFFAAYIEFWKMFLLGTSSHPFLFEFEYVNIVEWVQWPVFTPMFFNLLLLILLGLLALFPPISSLTHFVNINSTQTTFSVRVPRGCLFVLKVSRSSPLPLLYPFDLVLVSLPSLPGLSWLLGLFILGCDPFVRLFIFYWLIQPMFQLS